MTASAPRRKPLGGWTLAAWLLGAALVFYLLFFLITLVLQRMPEPIGSRAGLFVAGAKTTLYLTVVSGLIGLLVGMVAGLMRSSASRWVQAPASFFIWLVRGTPLLVQILFVYNALPPILVALGGWLGNHLLGHPIWQDIKLDEFWSAVVALSVNVGAYNAEVIRAGIQAIPRGQSEAARSLGLSAGQTMQQVVLPQAMRVVVPPLVNNMVALLKDSSLASAISLVELTMAGNRVSSETFLPIPVLTTIAGVYLVLTTVLTLFTDQLEKRIKIASR